MDFYQQFRTYIKFEDLGETFEIILPPLSVHNLIIGTTYIDLGGKSDVRILENDELKSTLRYTKRGWLSKEEFKVEGEVVSGKGKKDTELLYKMHGNWNSKIHLSPFVKGKADLTQKEVIFDKPEYPEKWEYMYGLSHFSL